MLKRLLSGFISLALCLICQALLVPIAGAASPGEVVGFSQTNFQGEKVRWVLHNKAFRHLLVPHIKITGKGLRSIQVGAGVRVKNFELPNFEGYPAGKPVITGNVASIGSGGIKSLIIFRDNQLEPGGLQIYGRTIGQIKVPMGKFYPLPTSNQWKDQCYNDKSFLHTPMTDLYLFGQHVTATLHNAVDCTGPDVALGGKSGTGVPSARFDPRQPPLSNMQRRVWSVRVVDNFNNFVKAPIKVKPIQIKPDTVSILPSLAGEWGSSLNVKYQISQKGNKAKWLAASLGQTGDITIDGQDLNAVYYDANGIKQNIKGKITRMLKNGYAQRIEWDNGVVFFREAKAKPPSNTVPGDSLKSILMLSGTWSSSIGRTYQISQQGIKFSWTVPGTSEKGYGSIKGKQVQVSFSSGSGSVSANGNISKIVNGNIAKEIIWDNGVIFYR